MKFISQIAGKLIVLSVLAAILITGCSGLGRTAFNGEVVKPSEVAPNIVMTDNNGNDFELGNMHGKVVLLFFGFTNCPDECPATMANLSQAMKILGDRAQDVQVVLVTTDPVRDTPQALGSYLANFNPTFLGITGQMDQLQKIWSDYGVTVMDGGETHSAYTYVIDQNGEMVLLFGTEMTPDQIAADLNALLAAN
jgi:protein SCO1/2